MRVSRAGLARGVAWRGPVYGALLGLAFGALYVSVALTAAGSWAALRRGGDGLYGIFSALAAGLSAAPFGAAAGSAVGVAAGLANGLVLGAVIAIKPPRCDRRSFLRCLLPIAAVVTAVVCVPLFSTGRRGPALGSDFAVLVALPTLTAEVGMAIGARRVARWYVGIRSRETESDVVAAPAEPARDVGSAVVPEIGAPPTG